MTVTRSTVGRFVLLGALYFAQGLPYGFFSLLVPVLLRKQGVSLAQIGLTALLVLPWALKFLWAPYLDRRWIPRLGRRRTWILAMQVAATLVLAGIAIVPGSEKMQFLLVAIFVLNLIAATQDIATDGLAVEILPPAERGFANGLQVAGYRVGMVVGGGVLLGAYEALGHRGLFAIMSVLTALATIPVIIAKEPTTVASADEAGASIASQPHFLRLPGVWRILLLSVMYKAGEAAAQGMLRPFLVDHHIDLKQIAWILGTVGFIAGMAGAVVGGVLVGRLGRKRALIAFGVGQVITVLGYAYLAFGAPSYRELYVWAGFEHFASGMATAALFTATMDWSRPTSSGTDYTVQASAIVIATVLASVLGGFSAQYLGYGVHFLLAAVMCVVAIVFVVWLFPRRPFHDALVVVPSEQPDPGLPPARTVRR